MINQVRPNCKPGHFCGKQADRKNVSSQGKEANKPGFDSDRAAEVNAR